MTGRRKVVGTFTTVLSVAFIVWLTLLLFPNPPSYQGKPIEQWLVYFDFRSGLSQTEAQAWMQKEAEAAEALRQMGPSAFPYMRQMLQPDSATARFIRRLRRQLGAETVSEETQMHRAVEACSALGPQAKALIPDLLQCMKSNPYRNNRSRAAYALGKIGGAAPEVVPALIESLKARPDGNVLIALGNYGAQAKSAVPAIVEAFHSADNNHIRYEAAHALQHIESQEAQKLLPRLRKTFEAEQNPWWQSRLKKVIDLIDDQ